MALTQTLEKIEKDIASGDYGKARDRLHGLLATYPDHLELRRKLGDVYWQLHDPAMAGRYWYLEADKSPTMTSACQAFEVACGRDPLHILLALKFKGDVDAIAEDYAGRTLLALHREASVRHSHYADFRKRGAEKWQLPAITETNQTGWAWIGCLVGVCITLGLIAIGLVTVWGWLSQFLFR